MYQKQVEGVNGIVARIVADSIANGVRITTFELEYPRFIHGEIMTHRVFSRNAMSSRAIPVERMITLVEDNPAVPIHWGKNQSGMQAEESWEQDVVLKHPHTGKDCEVPQYTAWLSARDSAVYYARAFARAGYHKQVVNRLLEPFQMMKVVLTSTTFDNFFHLRFHKDAQPEIKELAECMLKAYMLNEPTELREGEWHLPYMKSIRDDNGEMLYFLYEEGDKVFFPNLPLEAALMISCSCCAQVSYRRNDNSMEKAEDLYKRLVEADPVHASAFEHCATPMPIQPWEFISNPNSIEGITSLGRDNCLYSGNFKEWLQYRQLIPNHTCKSFDFDVVLNQKEQRDE